MKAFRIKQFEKIQTGYKVSLGNRTEHIFPNLIKTKAFLAETNRFLTMCFFEINEVYLQTYDTWRQLFFISDNVVFDNKCRQALEAAEGTLFNSWHRSSIKGGNDFAFINQTKALDFIEIILEEMLPGAIKRSDTYNRYRIECAKTKIIVLRLKLYNYGRTPIDVLSDKQNADDVLLDVLFRPTAVSQAK
jgi:hypothetical protein